jgi:hypothetical protein
MKTLIEDHCHPTFLNEAQIQLSKIVKSQYEELINPTLLFISMYGYHYNENGQPFYKYGYIGVDKANLVIISGFQVLWRSEDGSIIDRLDDLSDKKIIFWIENFPSNELVEDVIERYSFHWKRPKSESLIDKKKYRFKIREMGWFGASFPDVGLRIKTSTDLVTLSNIIEKAIDDFNIKSEANDCKNGLIHHFTSVKKKKGVYLFSIDAGSAMIEGIEEILNALNNSDFDIELVTLE